MSKQPGKPKIAFNCVKSIYLLLSEFRRNKLERYLSLYRMVKVMDAKTGFPKRGSKCEKHYENNMIPVGNSVFLLAYPLLLLSDARNSPTFCLD